MPSRPDSRVSCDRRVVDLLERNTGHRALRVVDEHVEAAETIDCCGDVALAVSRLRTSPATVALRAAVAQFDGDPFELGGVTPREHEFRARRGICLRDAEADALATAGDQGDLAFERGARSCDVPDERQPIDRRVDA